MVDHVIIGGLFKKICQRYFSKNRSSGFLDRKKVRSIVQKLKLLKFQGRCLFISKLTTIEYFTENLSSIYLRAQVLVSSLWNS